MGRNAIPDAVKKANGTFRRHLSNRDQPEGSAGFPVPPHGYDADEIDSWEHHCSAMASLGSLVIEDEFVIHELVQCDIALAKVRAFIKENGHTYVAQGSGLGKIRPEVKIEQELAKRYITLLGKAGLTPESRGRTVTASSLENAFAKFT